MYNLKLIIKYYKLKIFIILFLIIITIFFFNKTYTFGEIVEKNSDKTISYKIIYPYELYMSDGSILQTDQLKEISKEDLRQLKTHIYTKTQYDENIIYIKAPTTHTYYNQDGDMLFIIHKDINILEHNNDYYYMNNNLIELVINLIKN